jgi:hypothetical protein
MSNTANLDLPYLAAGQAQKHVTLNESLRILDALVQLAVVSRTEAAPPGSPTEGERYLVPSGASGGFAGHDGEIAAYQDGGWVFFAPIEGWIAWIGDEAMLSAFDGADWVEISGSHQNLPMVGIAAAADATNRLSIAADASLFNHDGSGHQIKLNKAGIGDTASLIFQTGFSGRAEIGLAGDDKLSFKVSADGSSWYEAFVALSNSNLGIGTNTPRTKLDIVIPNHYVLLQGGGGNGGTVLNSGDTLPIVSNAGFAGYNGLAIFPNRWGNATTIDAHTALYLAGSQRHGGAVAASLVFANWGYFTGTGSGAGGLGNATAQGDAVKFGIVLEENGGEFAHRLQFTSRTASGVTSDVMSLLSDGSLAVAGPVRVGTSTVAGLPPASSAGPGAMIYVSNESGGAVIAFSDGSNWRRMTDRVIVS